MQNQPENRTLRDGVKTSRMSKTANTYTEHSDVEKSLTVSNAAFIDQTTTTVYSKDRSPSYCQQKFTRISS